MRTMKFSSSLQQRDFFNKNGFVSFEELLSPQDLIRINEAVDGLSVTEKLECRDLFLRHETMKKIVLSSKLSQLAYEFLQKKPLRIGFDQLILEKAASMKGNSALAKENETFQDICCIGGLEGIFLISLKNSASDQELAAGSGILIKPSIAYPFFSTTPSATQRFLLIGYGGLYSQYLYQPRDPYCHYLKTLGYVFGDRLNDRDHPILLR